MSDEAPTGGLIVALPAEDDPTARDIEEAHVTMLWFGEAATIPPETVDGIRTALDDVAGAAPAFEAKVSGVGMIGPDKARVMLLESEELRNIRNTLHAWPPVAKAWSRAEQFPFYIPHMTLAYDGDLPQEWAESVRIDRLGLWLAGDKESWDLQEPAEPEDGDEVLAAAGDVVLPVRTLEDLDVGIMMANLRPEGRWYVSRRARALGAVDRIPAGWAS